MYTGGNNALGTAVSLGGVSSQQYQSATRKCAHSTMIGQVGGYRKQATAGRLLWPRQCLPSADDVLVSLDVAGVQTGTK